MDQQLVSYGTKVEHVMGLIQSRIERRALTEGARLPSVRAMAESSGFSKSTVVEAYERLVAEGTIQARPGSGFYVAPLLTPFAIADIEPNREREADPIWALRQSLSGRPDALKLGGGWLPESWLPQDLLRKGLRHLARHGDAETLLGHGSPLGLASLRQVIARRLLEQTIEVSPDQILLTASGTQAIDLVCRYLIEPGDAVLVDDPTYFNFHALLRAHRAKVIGVPFTPQGPDVEAFAQAVATHAPRLYITNSGVHNPTGATLSAHVARRVLKIAEAGNMVIVEDDIFADFETGHAPRYASFDGLDRVIRVGSFSKALSGSLRCGHIAARSDWIAGLADLRMATGMPENTLCAELVHQILTDGSYRRHMEHIRIRLADARGQAIRRLKAIGLTPWIEPVAGMFLWCQLPEGVEATVLARQALEEDIVLAPGNVFSSAQTASGFLRFNVAMMSDPRIDATLARLCAA
ncbi:aminotransferase-like domain-containing protein [Novosphingobium sp. Rr 2-17]|uniref:aminotransferase-like domain-containing protein n=1 Tax=Novosphingobium sp. Rr 2-17 TaxID=555793 RepID=UPI00031A026B|nr:PLP-dependent aminotransferase family protein [Novosphingobium sp. Rr 2-17]